MHDIKIITCLAFPVGCKDQIIVRIMAPAPIPAQNAEATFIKRLATLLTPKYVLTLPHSKSSVGIL